MRKIESITMLELTAVQRKIASKFYNANEGELRIIIIHDTGTSARLITATGEYVYVDIDIDINALDLLDNLRK